MPLPFIAAIAVRVAIGAAGKIIARQAANAAARKAAEVAARKAALEAAKKAAAQGLGKQAGTAATRDAAKKAAQESLKKSAGKGGGKGPGNTAGKHKAKKAKKQKLKCGEHGKYGDLKKKTGNNKFDRDHIPSKAALKARAEAILGRRLTAAQASAIDRGAAAIAIPKQAHIDISPTYGQSKAGAAKDAKNLAGSAKRDVNAMLKKIDEYDEDGNCRKAYKQAASKILKMSKKDFDRWILQTVKGVR